MRANEGCGARGQPHCDRNSPGPGRPFVSFEEEEEGGEEKTARKHTQALLRPSAQEDTALESRCVHSERQLEGVQCIHKYIVHFSLFYKIK